MRRILGVCAGLFLLTACGEPKDSSIVDLPPENDPLTEEPPPSDPQGDLSDGSPGASADNPHFFFLPPIMASPTYSGVAEEGLDPVVSVCPLGAWAEEEEACPTGSVLASFFKGALEEEDRLTEYPGLGYGVVWDTRLHPAEPGTVYRVSVSVVGQLVGYVDVLAFQGDASCEEGQLTRPECLTRPYNPIEGYAAFYHRGSLEIAFRIEEGAIESEYCDATGLEDCDVATKEPRSREASSATKSGASP